jgi:hypothetical protein
MQSMCWTILSLRCPQDNACHGQGQHWMARINQHQPLRPGLERALDYKGGQDESDTCQEIHV